MLVIVITQSEMMWVSPLYLKNVHAFYIFNQRFLFSGSKQITPLAESAVFESNCA